jgi:hypothetical protein
MQKQRENHFVAQNLVSSKYKQAKKQEYLSWVNQFNPNFFYEFIENGLIPFVNKYGYSICLSSDTLVKYLQEWAFSLVYINHHKSFQIERDYVYCFHNGGMEDFDYFTFKISPDDWNEFLDVWSESEFFDDSEAGFDQRAEFYMFTWRVIDLYNSKTYKKYIMQQEADDEYYDDNGIFLSHHTNEESMAYGGDRRTYS